jgi:predicted ArsR family transcriptional regulator
MKKVTRERQVLQLLFAAPTGLTSSELAVALGTTKARIRPCLSILKKNGLIKSTSIIRKIDGERRGAHVLFLNAPEATVDTPAETSIPASV